MAKERFTEDIVQDSNVYIVSEMLDCIVDQYGNTLPKELKNHLYETQKMFLDEVTKNYPKGTDIGKTTFYERIEFIPHNK